MRAAEFIEGLVILEGRLGYHGSLQGGGWIISEGMGLPLGLELESFTVGG